MNRNCMGDIGMAAFSVIFMQTRRFQHISGGCSVDIGRSNCESLFAIPGIPGDNHIRDIGSRRARPAVSGVCRCGCGARRDPWRLGTFRHRVMSSLPSIAPKIHCRQNCSTRPRGKGEMVYFQAMLGPRRWRKHPSHTCDTRQATRQKAGALSDRAGDRGARRSSGHTPKQRQLAIHDAARSCQTQASLLYPSF
jgi:hypothetical protein